MLKFTTSDNVIVDDGGEFHGMKGVVECIGTTPYHEKYGVRLPESYGLKWFIPEDLIPVNGDAVESPGHYTAGGVETIDYIRAKLSPEGFQGYCAGNVLKYVSRYELKNGLEDLKKASKYLEWLIEAVEKKGSADS